MKKLYILVRSDLPPGLQLAQTAHAAMQFAQERPEAFGAWFRSSNNVAILQVASEAELRVWAGRAQVAGMDVATFTEPDLSDEATAVAILPPPGATGRIFSRLPLAGKAPQCGVW